MVSKVVLSSEGLAADVARVGSLVGVGSHVYEQVVTFGEVTIAILADKLFLRPLSGHLSAEEGGGVWHLESRVHGAGGVLVLMMMMGCGLATASPGSQISSVPEPVVDEDRGVIWVLGRHRDVLVSHPAVLGWHESLHANVRRCVRWGEWLHLGSIHHLNCTW